MNVQQRQLFGKLMSEELQKMQISWTSELRQWHVYALQALDFASCVSLEIQPILYPKLFETDTHGINMNIVAVLANNLEARTPRELGLTTEGYNEVLQLNIQVSKQWEGMAEPIRKSVTKKVELQNGVPQMTPILTD